MYSVNSHTGCNSHLYNAIRSYLNSENRAQPIIGLNSITEMWTYNQPPVYFCDVCFLRVIKTDIRNHIMGSLHRYNYIKSHHAHGWRSYTDLTLLARPLMDLAKIVEKREGTGDVQFLYVDDILYKEMTSWPVPAAFGKLKRIMNHQDPNVLEGNESCVQGLQEFENRDEITSQCRAPTQHVSASPLRSKYSGIIDPFSQPLNPSRTPSSPRPVRPLFQSQEASTPQSQRDSRFLSRTTNLESSLALVLGQHINQDQAVIQGRNQIPQGCMMSSETQCFTETRSTRVSRMIPVLRPPRHWSPIRIPCQNDTVPANEEEEENGVNHPFGAGYESPSLHPAQTTDAYKAQLHTSHLTVNHMGTEKTQNVTNRQESYSSESLTGISESVRTMELISVIEPIITQRETGAFQPPFMYDFNQFSDEADFQEPLSTDLEAHVEAKSHTFVEEKVRLPSQILQSSATQTQNPSDSPETYTGKKPLIGLEAVIKCQSVDGNPPLCCYLCQLCSLKVKRKNIVSHLSGCQHQRNYIKVLHPEVWSNIKHIRCNINEMLEDVAMQLEQEDGRGQIKVTRLSACLISEVLHRDYHWCMKVLNCGASVETFKKRTDKTTGPSHTPKRPAESIQSHFGNDGAPLSTYQISKKMKKVDPTNVTFTKNVKNPVFKVSLSLQEGPIVIERAPLKVTATVAPEIEDQSPKSSYTENNALSLGNDRQSEVQTCIHGCSLTVYNSADLWNTQQFPDGSMLTQPDISTLAYTHTEGSHIDGCMFEDQFVSPAQYAYTGQFDYSQAIQVVEPSLRHDCGSPEEMGSLTRADWPGQDWFINDSDWILQRQMTGGNPSNNPEDTRYIWY